MVILKIECFLRLIELLFRINMVSISKNLTQKIMKLILFAYRFIPIRLGKNLTLKISPGSTARDFTISC